VDMK